MATGLAYIFITGFFWALVGVAQSVIARRRYNFLAIMSIGSILSALVAWIFLADYAQLSEITMPQILPLAIVMVLSGALASIGILFMNKAMRVGHNAIVWSTGQSAFIFPFLFGILAFKEPLALMKTGGIVLVLISIFLFGSASRKEKPNGQSQSSKWWFLTALCALACLGAHQILTTIPSHWKNFNDSANMRVPLIFSGIAVAYVIACLAARQQPARKHIIPGLIITAIGLPGQIFLYLGMDLLATVDMLSLAYPIAVGTCILGFALYSTILLRERASIAFISGLVLGVSGLVLLYI